MTARFVALLPSLTDGNGDAQNARVLAQRARWAGEDAAVVHLEAGDAPPSWRPAAVVLGSAPDSALPALRDAVLPFADALAGWLGDGVPVLAVDSGLELLTRRVVLPRAALEGLGLVHADAVPLAARVADDLVVEAAEGRLVGFENHARGLRLDADVAPLGRVVAGTGDGAGTDGVRHGGVVGTRLHGPVLAKNPALADAILSVALGRAVAPDTAGSRQADALAASIRAGVPAR